MSVTTTDARSKQVYNQLVDKVSTMYALRSLGTDMGAAMKLGESVDIVTRAAVTIESATTAGAAASMSTQTISPVANNLVVDQHYGAIVGIGKMSKTFDMEGAWSGQLAAQILVELGDYMDQDWIDDVLRVGAYSSTAAYTANAAADALTVADTEDAMAKMTDQRGVREQDCVWIFGPYGIGSLRSVSAFTPHENAIIGSLGMPVVGRLHGLPVVRSQSVPKVLTVATTAAVTTDSGVTHTYTVAAGHGLTPGMKVTVAGHDAHENISTATAITSVTATSIVVTTSATTDGTSSAATGLITATASFNCLLHMPWNFIRQRQIPDIQIVPTSGKIQDELQADSIWGVKSLAGCAVSLLSPASSVA